MMAFLDSFLPFEYFLFSFSSIKGLFSVVDTGTAILNSFQTRQLNLNMRFAHPDFHPLSVLLILIEGRRRAGPYRSCPRAVGGVDVFVLGLNLMSCFCCRTGQAGRPLCHMPEGCYKDCQQRKTQRVCSYEGKTFLSSELRVGVAAFTAEVKSSVGVHWKRQTLKLKFYPLLLEIK